MGWLLLLTINLYNGWSPCPFGHQSWTCSFGIERVMVVFWLNVTLAVEDHDVFFNWKPNVYIVELLPPLSCTSTCYILVVDNCETTLTLSSCNGGTKLFIPSRYTFPVIPIGAKAGP